MFSRGKEDIPEADTSGVGPCECRAAGLAVGMHQWPRWSVSAHQSGESRGGSAPANWNFCLLCKVIQGVGLHLDGPTGQDPNSIAFAWRGREQPSPHAVLGVFGAQQRFGLDRQCGQKFLVGASREQCRSHHHRGSGQHDQNTNGVRFGDHGQYRGGVGLQFADGCRTDVAILPLHSHRSEAGAVGLQGQDGAISGKSHGSRYSMMRTGIVERSTRQMISCSRPETSEVPIDEMRNTLLRVSSDRRSHCRVWFAN